MARASRALSPRAMAILAMPGHGQDARGTAGETPALLLRGLGFHFYLAYSVPANNLTFT